MRSIDRSRLALGVLMAAGVLATAVLGGCGHHEHGGAAAHREGPQEDETAVAEPEPEPPAGPPVTDEECRAFVAAVDGAVQSRDVAAFSALVDWDALLKTATAGIEVAESSRKGFVQGVKSSMQQEQGVVPRIVATVKEGGSFTFLHQRARDTNQTALFRLVMPDSNVGNYYEFVLARRPDGKVRAVDIHDFLSGELISQAMRRIYIPVAAQVSRGLQGRLRGTEPLFMKNLPRFEQMTTEVRNGRPAEALKIYRQLPPELQKDKNLLMRRIEAAQEVSDEEYSRAIEDFRTAHPDDPCIDMISIDYYLLKKDYPRALACIGRLEQAVGGDPYLNITRANIHTEEKRYDVAKQDAQRAIAQEPSLQDAYWSLVTISLHEHDYAGTVALLNQLGERFRIPFGDMTQLPVFSEFVKSPEYRAWKEGRAAGPQP
jgi:hypothetical protein